ncbi:MAG: hypothetical protein M5U34_24375 [Chloroflexi bacterium]|nr:hypothetical protein [Chloroflexota bacterium]
MRDRVEANAVFDLLIAVDCGDELRMGKPFANLAHKPTIINIDHHVTNSLFGDINWSGRQSHFNCGNVVCAFHRDADYHDGQTLPPVCSPGW